MLHVRYDARVRYRRAFNSRVSPRGGLAQELIARRRRKTAPTNSREQMPRTLLPGVRTRVTSVSGGEYMAARLFAGALVRSKSLPCHLQNKLCLEREKEEKGKDTPTHLSPRGGRVAGLCGWNLIKSIDTFSYCMHQFA